jgi:hypothetical protein
LGVLLSFSTKFKRYKPPDSFDFETNKARFGTLTDKSDYCSDQAVSAQVKKTIAASPNALPTFAIRNNLVNTIVATPSLPQYGTPTRLSAVCSPNRHSQSIGVAKP